MKFLSKSKTSNILAEKIVYKPKGDNRRLREMLAKEQKGFCAYTEKRFEGLDSVDVEHFDKSKKDKGDDYFNAIAFEQFGQATGVGDYDRPLLKHSLQRVVTLYRSFYISGCHAPTVPGCQFLDDSPGLTGPFVGVQ